MPTYVTARNTTPIPRDELNARVVNFLVLNGIAATSAVVDTTNVTVVAPSNPATVLTRYVSSPAPIEMGAQGVDLGTDATSPAPMSGGTGVKGWLSTISDRVVDLRAMVTTLRDTLLAAIGAGGAVRTIVESTPETNLAVTVTTPVATNKKSFNPSPNAGGVLTLDAPASGKTIEITELRVARIATSVLSIGSTLTVTTTNLNSVDWKVGASIGVLGQTVNDFSLVNGVRAAAAATAVTFTFPAPGANISWTVQAFWREVTA